LVVFGDKNSIKNCLNCHGSHQRIRELDKKGLISLPKAQPRGGVWRKYFYIQSKDKEFIR
jgi:hypothetical protein